MEWQESWAHLVQVMSIRASVLCGILIVRVSTVLTEGEPLDKGRRFRLRGYTGVVLVVFLLGHVSAYQTYLHISDCEAFPVSGISANAVRIVLFAVIGLLYFVGPCG